MSKDKNGKINEYNKGETPKSFSEHIGVDATEKLRQHLRNMDELYHEEYLRKNGLLDNKIGDDNNNLKKDVNE